jgi:bacteriocin-like protein
MKTNLNQTAGKVRFAALTKKEMAKVSGGGLPGTGDMTPKERCEYNNVGRCGACDKEGVFIPCA